jgi:hypothetical protein
MLQCGIGTTLKGESKMHSNRRSPASAAARHRKIAAPYAMIALGYNAAE